MQGAVCSIPEPILQPAQIGKGHNTGSQTDSDERSFYMFIETVQIGKKFGGMKKDVTLKIKTPQENLDIFE